jgi:hypothetical protein
MVVFLWFAGVGIALTGLPAALFFALHLATGEPVPLARAKLLWHWVIVIGLGTFDIAIFTRVVQGILAVW